MKKLLTMLLVCTMVFSIMPASFGLEPISTGKCGENLTWVLDHDGTLTISGTGEMSIWERYEDVPWYNQKFDIKSVVIDEGINYISTNSFYGCSSLKNVNIPSSVIAIGSYAFYGCIGLTSITIPNGVKYIWDYAFCGCSGLTSITIPDGLKYIRDYAFCGCSGLTSIDIPDSVDTIGKSAFECCTGLTSITIPKDVTMISPAMFFNCHELTSIRILGESVFINESAFAYCRKLTDITIPEGVIFIYSGVFYGCESLKKISIPSSVSYIFSGSFSDCPALTDIYYTGSEEDWNNIYIDFYNDSLHNAEIHFNYVPTSFILKGKELTFEQQPIIENGQTFVPLRAMLEALGADVSWDGTSQTVTAVKGDTTISLTIGKKVLKKNGRGMIINTAPMLINNHTFFPMRAAAEAFNCTVEWNGETRTVIIE